MNLNSIQIDTEITPNINLKNSQDEKLISKTLGHTFTVVDAKKPMHETSVQKYQVDIDSRITDLFKLLPNEMLEILQAVNDKYIEIEKSNHPAAGYEVHFKVIAKGKRPIEVILEACGERKIGSEIEMPQLKGEECAFCKNENVMPGYEDAITDSARVIESLEENPLIISNKHAKHFFDLSIENQQDMLNTAIKATQIYTQEKCSRFTLSSHVGIKGHQTFPHAHIHALGSFFKK